MLYNINDRLPFKRLIVAAFQQVIACFVATVLIPSICGVPIAPAMVGAANREMMLKQLSINVNSLYARQEQNMVRFVLGFVKLDEMTTAGDDMRYLTALWQIGNQLGFKNTGTKGGASSIGGDNFFA